MANIDANQFMGAADALLKKLEDSGLLSKKEEEKTRKDLAKQIRDEAKEGAKGLGTIKVGAARVLVPTSANLRQINLISERSRRRFSNFRLQWLSPRQVRKLRADGGMQGTKPGEFIRHSRRLARHVRSFLGQIKELEPSLEEEVEATLLELEDAQNDLLKLEVASFTSMRETLVRAVNGRMRRSELVQEIEGWDINRHLWNLSLLEHPKAAVQQLLADASSRMGEAVSETVSQIPKRSEVVVGIPPIAEGKMTPQSRTADIAWRLFSQAELDARYAKLPKKQGAQASWRGLGLDYNTPEWYVPVPQEAPIRLAALLAARRKDLLADASRRSADEAAKKAKDAEKTAEKREEKADEAEKRAEE